jgi:hypothetical protein
MTAIPAGLSRADRRRLLERLAELRELDRLMRQPGTLTAPRGRDGTTAERRHDD